MGEMDQLFQESDVADSYWRDVDEFEWSQLIESDPLPAYQYHLMESSESAVVKMAEPAMTPSAVGSDCSEEHREHSDTKLSDQTE
jgi:hypothetical protein